MKKFDEVIGLVKEVIADILNEGDIFDRLKVNIKSKFKKGREKGGTCQQQKH